MNMLAHIAPCRDFMTPLRPLRQGDYYDAREPYPSFVDAQTRAMIECLQASMYLWNVNNEAWAPYQSAVLDTINHQNDVALLADKIAVRMGLSVAERRDLFVAACLHDFGKVACKRPDILFKHSGLTVEERDLYVKPHVTDGEGLIALEIVAYAARVPSFGMTPDKASAYAERIAKIAAAHHENADGTGYPRNLTQQQMTLPMQCLAAADFCDALARKRPYKNAHSFAEVIVDVVRETGHKFDSEIVKACSFVLSQQMGVSYQHQIAYHDSFKGGASLVFG